MRSVVSAAVTTDRSVYRAGQAVAATVANTGTTTLYGGGGVGCGLVQVEVDLTGAGGWAPVLGGDQVCPAVAIVLHPGERRTETLTARPAPGRYRLVVRVTAESGGSRTFYSAPFTVTA